MTLRKGQKVRVTFEGEYDAACANGGHYIRHRCQPPAGQGGTYTGHFHLGPDATIEPIEDLKFGDAVFDQMDDWYRFVGGEKPWLCWKGCKSQHPDNFVARPFKLHIRDGEIIAASGRVIGL